MSTPARPPTEHFEFYKYHGCGNDFVLVDGTKHPNLNGEGLGVMAPRLCDRRLGIGADQVLFIEARAHRHQYGLRIWNSDGSEAGMCGNGLRCTARHVTMRLGDFAEVVTFFISDRPYSVRVLRDQSGGFRAATVTMGTPEFEAQKIPTTLRNRGESVIDVALPDGTMSAALQAAGIEPRLTCVSMGNPHAVFFGAATMGELSTDVMRGIEHAAWFPERTNVHFCVVESRSELRLRTWERGVGTTFACGSGACAVVAAGVARGLLDRQCRVKMHGGEVDVYWAQGGTITLSGPAEEVFSGIWRGGKGEARLDS